MIKVGQAEKNLGGAERDFGRSVHTHFLQPLRRFLEGDMKTIIVGKPLASVVKDQTFYCRSYELSLAIK